MEDIKVLMLCLICQNCTEHHLSYIEWVTAITQKKCPIRNITIQYEQACSDCANDVYERLTETYQ